MKPYMFNEGGTHFPFLSCRFHILSDFDEGKRSCRRKLERHNDRRRRKSIDIRSVAEKEPDGISPADAVVCDDEIGRGIFNST